MHTTNQPARPGQHVVVQVDGQPRPGIILGARHDILDGQPAPVVDVELTDGHADDTYRHAPTVTVPAADVWTDRRIADETSALMHEAVEVLATPPGSARRVAFAARKTALLEVIAARDDGEAVSEAARALLAGERAKQALRQAGAL